MKDIRNKVNGKRSKDISNYENSFMNETSRIKCMAVERRRPTLALLVAALLVSSFIVVFLEPFSEAEAASITLALTQNELFDPPNPQIALVDGGGASNTVYVVWRDFNSTLFGGQIKLAKSTDGGMTFDPFITVSSELDVDAFNPQIVVNSTNTDEIYVVYQTLDALLFINNIMLAKSTDGGATFSAPVLISDGLNDIQNPQIAISEDGTTLFIVWQALDPLSFTNQVQLITSTDGGANFSVPLAISDGLADGTFPQIAVSEPLVVVVWQELNIDFVNEIFVATSSDSGSSFSASENLSNAAADGFDSLSPDVFASGSTVIVTWQQENVFDGIGDIYIAKSTDSGSSFVTSNLSNSVVIPNSPAIGHSPDKDHMFIVWEDNYSFDTSTGSIFVVHSADGGSTIECGTIAGITADDAANPDIVSDNSGVAYAIWEDDLDIDFFNDLTFTDNLDYLAPFITIDHVNTELDVDGDLDADSRWGIADDAVIVSGKIANAEVGDSVEIDWGDGNVTSIEITAGSSGLCSWGPVSHAFDSSVTGTVVSSTASLVNGITGLDEITSLDAPSSIEVLVEVLPHATSLSLDPINSVGNGTDVTVTGVLFDEDMGVGATVAGMAITFTGSGAGGLGAGATTAGDGTFSISGASPSTPATGWQVQAHFAGDTPYDASNSEIEQYSTVDLTIVDAFAVTAGAPTASIALDGEGYSASIVFENATTDGSVFVQACDSTANARYELLSPDICLEISLGVTIEPGSNAFITVPFNSASVPTGFANNEVAIFFEEVADTTYRDISSSQAANSVTGSTDSFGKFVVGAAVHADTTDSPVVRKQIFVGNDNEVNFRDVTINTNPAPTVSLDSTTYDVGDTAQITLVDVDANFNLEAIDSAFVTVNSTSDPTGISIELQEGAADSGTFTGSFTISSSASSEAAGILNVDEGDDFSVLYEREAGARVQAIFDNVTEAGLVEINDITLPDGSTPFEAIGGAVDIDLIDAQVDDTTDSITIIMSYANANLGGNDPTTFAIFRNDGGWVEIGGDVDTVAKTITAQTNGDGEFSLGISVGGGGGGGGGLGIAGSGLVVDFLASVALSNDDGDETMGGAGGGASGGRRVVIVNQDTPTATLPESHFAEHPLDRIQVDKAGFIDNDGNPISQGSTGRSISIASTFTNHQQQSQSYSFIVLIIDEDGFAVDVAWQEGNVESGETVDLSSSWMPKDGGNYTIKIFVWDGFDNPTPLSSVVVNQLTVV